jgi:hypothetical protein
MIFSNDSVSWDVGVRDALRRENAVACPGAAPEAQRFFIECRICGFEPAQQESLPGHACPKCFSHAWQRVIRPGTILSRDVRVPSTARLRRLTMARRA